eukprot:scaffold22610_cov115-Cylindrotheca_fusiformis.AAC.8
MGVWGLAPSFFGGLGESPSGFKGPSPCGGLGGGAPGNFLWFRSSFPDDFLFRMTHAPQQHRLFDNGMLYGVVDRNLNCRLLDSGGSSLF